MNKKFLAILFIAFVMCFGLTAGAQDSFLLDVDFETSIPSDFVLNEIGGGQVKVENGKAVITAGGNAFSLARMQLPEFELNNTAVSFHFSAKNTNGTSSFGVVKNGSDNAIISVTSGILTVGEKTVTLSENVNYWTVINFKDNEIQIHLNGEKIYSGTLDLNSADALYFCSVATTGDISADFQLWNLKAAAVSEEGYAFSADIKDGDLVHNIENINFEFNTLLVAEPKILLTDINGKKTVVTPVFDGYKLNIEIADFLEPLTDYTLTVSGIQTLFGSMPDETINFRTLYEGYIMPEITLSEVRSEYRTGQIVTVIPTVTPSDNIEKTKLVFDDETVEEADGVETFTYRVQNEGVYTLWVEAFDGFVWVKSDVYTVTVETNEVPVIVPHTFESGKTLNIKDNIVFQITDDIQITDVVFWIDGKETGYIQKNDLYTLDCEFEYLGDIAIKASVTDSDGVTIEKDFSVVLVNDAFIVKRTVDYEGDYTLPSGYNIYLQGTYTSSEKTLIDKDDSEKNLTTAYVITKPNGTSGAVAYASMSAGKKGIFRVSCDMYFMNNTNCVWLIRGKNSEFVNAVKLSNGSISIGETTKKLETQKWYRISFIVNTITQMYEFSIDDEFLTPEGGLAFPTPLVAPEISDIRINFTMGNDHSLALDNWSYEEYLTTTYLTGLKVEDNMKTLRLGVSESINAIASTIPKALDSFTLVQGANEIKPQSVEYDYATNEILINFDKRLYSGAGYTLYMNANVIDLNEVSDGTNFRKSFTTDPKEIDVVDFKFNYSDGMLGADAVLRNNSDKPASAVMILSVLNEKGAVISVRASKEVTAAPGKSAMLHILPAKAEGASAEAVFVNDWTEYFAIKDLVETINLN